MWKPLDNTESTLSLELVEGVVGGLENVIYCAEVDLLKWCCIFRDRIVVALADDWRIKRVVKIKITPSQSNGQHGLHIGSSWTLIFVVTRYDDISALVHKPKPRSHQ